MICCCEKCKFVFESIFLLTACPDCGKGPVREATEAEKSDYQADRRRYGPMKPYGGIRSVEIPLVVGWDNGEPVFAEQGILTKIGPNGEILSTARQDEVVVRNTRFLF